jgi:hypothetical protein
LLEAKLDSQQLAGEYPAALQTITSLRALEEKPAARLTTGLFDYAFLQAAIETKNTTGPLFEQSFTRHYRESIDPLRGDVVQDSIRSAFRFSQVASSGYIIGRVQTDLDPASRMSGALDNLQAWDLIEARVILQFFVPLKTQCAEVLGPYIKAHNVPKPDIWPAREAILSPKQKLTPVLVGIWDSGVDVSLFQDQLFTDPNPTASGAHGLAFDDRGNPSSCGLVGDVVVAQDALKVGPELFRKLVEGGRVGLQ